VKISKLATSLIFALLLQGYSFAEKSETKPVFVIKPGPPPGFELLAKDPHQHTYISVFYGGDFLSNAMADFDNDSLTLEDPQKIVAKIPGLLPQKRQEVLRALSQKLPANANLLCPFSQGWNCHQLFPKIAGVIFDAQNYRADVFINPKELDLIRRGPGELPNSSAGFSFLSQNELNATQVQNFKGDTWTNTSIIGEGNSQLTNRFAYTQSTSNGVSTSQFNLQTFSASHYQGGILTQVGMVNENTGDFFNTPSLGGVDLRNYGVFTNLSQEIQGTPLVVYLAMPSTVVVQRQGQILAAVSLPAGRQEIDTTNFPIGAYEVTITITTRAGQVSSQTQFYVKQEALPAYGKPHFDLAFGVLQRTSYSIQMNQTVTTPGFISAPVFSYYDMRRLFQDLGLASSFLSSGDRSYLSEVLHWYEDELDLAPGLMLSSQKDVGAMFNTTYTGSFSSLNLQAMKLWPKQVFENGLTDINQSSETFYPLPTNEDQLQADLSFFKGTQQLSLGGTWYKDFMGDIQTSESIAYTKTLGESEGGDLLLGASLTHQPGNDTGLMTLTYTFFSPNVNGSAVIDLSNQDQAFNGSQNYTPGMGVSLTRSFSPEVNQVSSISVNASGDKNAQTLGLSGNLMDPWIDGTAALTQNDFAPGYGTNNTTYTADLQSTIAYAGGHWAMGYNQGYATGVEVEVFSPKPGTFELYDNDSQLGEFSMNMPHPVFVAPYTIHRFTIQPNTADIYKYDQNPKEAVLYQGNVEYLSWALKTQYLLFAQIENSQHQPLSNYLLENQGEYDTTDDQGYVEAGLTLDVKTLQFIGISGDKCTVTLPKLPEIQGGVWVIARPLVCEKK